MKPATSPSELILARCRAFGAGDFGFIYDSYHPDSNFRRQFPDRRDYLAYARSALAVDFHIVECRILREEAGEQARVIFYLDTLYRGRRVEILELALLLRTDGGWCYHSGQKIDRSDFAGEIEAIDWLDFEKISDKAVF